MKQTSDLNNVQDFSQNLSGVALMHVIQSTSGGGAEAVAKRIAEHQARHFTISFLTWEDEKTFNIPANVRHHKVSRKLKGLVGLLSLALAIRRVLKREKIDVVIAHLPYSAVAVALATRRLQLNKVFVHHSSSSDAPARLPSWAVRKLYRGFKVVAVSEDSANSLANYVDRSEISVFPNPLTLVNAPARRSRKLNGSLLRFLAIGRIAKVKNYPFMLTAVSKMHQDFELSIIGDGNTEELGNLAQDLGIAKKVKFLGWLDSAKIHEYFENSDIFLMTSDYEGEPSSLLEAASAGLVVVGRDTPGLGSALEKVGGFVPESDTPEDFAETLRKLATKKRPVNIDRSWMNQHEPNEASHAYCKLALSLYRN